MRNRSGNGNVIPAKWLVDNVIALGVDRTQLAMEIGCDPDDFLHRDFALGVEKYDRVLAFGADYVDNPAFGLTLSQIVKESDFGLLGYLVANAPNLGATLELLCRFHDIFTPNFGVSVRLDGECAKLIYRAAVVAGSDSRQDIDLSLALFLKGMRGTLGADWCPAHCNFTYDLDMPTDMHRTIFGENLSFSQSENSFTFPSIVLMSPVSDADPALLSVLLAQAHQALDAVENHDDITRRVKLLLIANLGERIIDTAAIAAELNLSISSLYRRLAEAGTSFKEIRNEVLVEAAREALSNTQIPITQIALKLGYSETSAFIRGFKKLTGKTPLQFRKSNL